MCQEPVPYINLHQHQFWERLHGAHVPGLESPPQPCYPKMCPELGPLQDNAEAVSYFITKGNFTHLQVLLSLTLLSALLTPSAVWLFYPPCQIIPWSKIITAEKLQFEFLLHHVNATVGFPGHWLRGIKQLILSHILNKNSERARISWVIVLAR